MNLSSNGPGSAAAAAATATSAAAVAAAAAAARGVTGAGGNPSGPNGTEDVIALPHRLVSSVSHVTAVGAVSWRGRNPASLKINQDAVVVAEHGPTASLLVAVFDGHGVNGREVSSFFKERYPLALFTDKRFQTRSLPPALGPGGKRRGSPNARGISPTADLEDSGSVHSDSGSVKGGRSGSPRRGGAGGGASSTTAGLASALCDVMADVLLATELALIQASGINVTLSGSTSVVVLVRDGLLHCINTGDSRCILSSCPTPVVPLPAAAIAAASAYSTPTGNPTAGMPPPSGTGMPGDGTDSDEALTSNSVRIKVLTIDHKPDLPRERQRITSCGGRVMATRIRGAPHVSTKLL